MDMKKKILVVDDDESILKGFKRILEWKGYIVDTAKTGQEALEKSTTGSYNLALLDIRLPDMEGTKLLVKMHRISPKMMKIMVTGYPSLENSVESLNFGADAYIMKPVEPEELLKVVEQKLKEQQEAVSVSEEKVTEWIRNRLIRMEDNVMSRGGYY
jgi:DNA-binding NtrC family response regulator